jgi:taurine-pyruvate aminotransferase
MSKDLQIDELIELEKKHLWLHLTNHKTLEGQEPQIMVSGQGCRITDARGREYLDMLSGGVWCVNVGYGRESLAQAAAEQLRTLPYYAGTVATPPYIRLATKLAFLLPELPKVYIANSGSEANEKAFKMSRLYFGVSKNQTGKHKIIYRDRDYHGSTLAVLAAGGQQERRAGYGPFPDGFVEIPHACCYRCPFGKEYPQCEIDCARALETTIAKEDPDTVAAVILEPITAGGGIIPPVPEYFPIIQEICRKHEVLLIMDEVVAGFGRTGKMFGHQHYTVTPDIVTLAKGIASSYMPLSATMTTQKIFERFLTLPTDTFGYFRDISTYGGCAAGCSVGLENIRIIEDEKLVENSAVLGKYLLDQLKQFADHPMVGDIRGLGLFAGIEIVEDKKSKAPSPENTLAAVVASVKQQGILMGRMGRSVPGFNNVLTLAPALVVTKAEIDATVNAIGVALGNLKPAK